MDKPIYVVNVFSEVGMTGGNQLAVILDAADLSTKQMQMVAKQMNYSESTFVTEISDNSVEFRIFVPNSEIPYAGHPTIGTTFLIEYLNRIEGKSNSEGTAKLKAGEIKIKFTETDNGELDLVYMDQLPVTYYGNFDDVGQLCKALGLSSSDLNSEIFPIYAPASMKFVIITLQSNVDDIDPNFNLLSEVLDQDQCVVVICKDHSNIDFNSRMFAPNQGINEDPATGSAQDAIIHALDQLQMLPPNKNQISIKQGYSMGRPSILHNLLTREAKLHVRTGGRTTIVLKGSINI